MVIQTWIRTGVGEVEESVAGEEAAPVFEDVPDLPVAVLRVAFPMMFRQR